MLNDEENQKYFQYFTIHSALRFIERYVITSKDPQTQCKKSLPILFNMLKEQLSDSGVDVVSYFGTRAVSHKDKEGEEYLTITCNPNIVIYPKTDIERKFFGSHGIIIGLAEYKSPEAAYGKYSELFRLNDDVIRAVLFQCLLLDDLKIENGMVFANLYTIYLLW